MKLPDWRVWAVGASLVGGLAIFLWAHGGPYASTWAAAQQRGTASAKPAVAATPAVPDLPRGLVDTVSGELLAGDQGRELILRGTGTGTAPLGIAVHVTQSTEPNGGQVQLRTADHVPWCAGPVTGVSGGNTIQATCASNGQQVTLQITIQSLDGQRFSGVLRTGA